MAFENISPEALAAWRRLSASWGSNLPINSGYRDPQKNAAVGGAKGSQHIHGNAFDVDVSGLSREQRIALIEQAKASGFGGIGVYNNALHFDVGPERAWGPDYHRGSLPEWATAALAGPSAQYAGDQGQPQEQPQGQPDQPAPQMNDQIMQQMLQQRMAEQQSFQLDPRAFMRERNALAVAPIQYERRNLLGSVA